MTMVAMPTVRANAMPTSAAGKDGIAVGKDAGARDSPQFAAVLQQRAQVQQGSVASKRLDARGQDRKDGTKVRAGDGGEPGVVRGASAVVVSPAAMVPVGAAAGSGTSVAAEPEKAVAVAGGAPETAGLGTMEDASGATVEPTRGSEPPTQLGGSDVQAAETPAIPESGSEAAGSVGSRIGDFGPLDAVRGADTLLPELMPSVGGLSVGFAKFSGAAVQAAGAAVATRGASAKAQVSGAKGAEGKASGMGRQMAAGHGAALERGEGNAGNGAGAQAGIPGETGPGEHGGKGEARPGVKGSAEAAGNSAQRGGATSDALSGGTAQPASIPTAPAQIAAPAMLPTAAGPVAAPPSVPAGDHNVASVPGEAAGSVRNDVDSGIAQAAPLTSVGAARLLKTVAGSELRVGTQSADLGAVTIRTVLGREQIEAHISFENERMGSALSTHLLGGALEDRLAQGLGVRASVTLSSGGQAGTGESGREVPREGTAGQPGSQAGGQMGNPAGGGNGGGSRDGSGRYGAQTAAGSLGGNAGSGSGLGVSRSTPYGGGAAMEGRLDIRI